MSIVRLKSHIMISVLFLVSNALEIQEGQHISQIVSGNFIDLIAKMHPIIFNQKSDITYKTLCKKWLQINLAKRFVKLFKNSFVDVAAIKIFATYLPYTYMKYDSCITFFMFSFR